MKINLDPNATFRAPVFIEIPGKEEPVEVEFVFRALPRAHVRSLLILTRMIRTGVLRRWWELVRCSWKLRRIIGSVDIIDGFSAGWSRIEPGYSRANLASLLQEYPSAAVAIYIAFIKGWNEERRKN